MSCECNITINELLCFIQNKCHVMDELSLVQICISWYNEEEIESAKAVLCEISGKRKIARKGDKKSSGNVSDILKIIKETENLPKFVARDLNRLPPVTFDHLDISSLLKSLASMRNEMQLLKEETKLVTTKLEKEISALKNKNSDLSTSVAGQESYVGLPAVPCVEIQNADTITESERAPAPLKHSTVLNFRQAVLKQVQNTPTHVSESFVNDGFTTVSRGKKRQRIENYTEPREKHNNQPKNKRGTNTTTSLRVAERKIPIYVSRFANDCTETDIQNYFIENGLTIYGIETLQQKNNTDFKSFKVTVAKKDLGNVLKEEFWPESIVFRIYKQGKSEQLTGTVNA